MNNRKRPQRHFFKNRPDVIYSISFFIQSKIQQVYEAEEYIKLPSDHQIKTFLT